MSDPFRTARRVGRIGLGVSAALMLASLTGCVGEPVASGPPSPYGYMCYAGVYTCRLTAQYPIGSPCQCPGIGAPSYGTVH